jgi:hypothetical protein
MTGHIGCRWRAEFAAAATLRIGALPVVFLTASLQTHETATETTPADRRARANVHGVYVTHPVASKMTV